MSSMADAWVGAELAARYQVTAELGAGGMGSVYRAFDSHLDVDVVIKVPHPFLLRDPAAAARFAQEARSLVKLAHPHVVSVIDVGQHDGHPFVVMQFLAGGSLEDRCPKDQEGRPLPIAPDRLDAWLSDIAAALDFMHGQGYVHRDIKPGNILFDEHGHAFLSDFGIAKALDQDTGTMSAGLTGTGMVLGTPQYMAPELVMGKPFDGRIDQYALAVMIFQLTAGRLPFEADSPTAILVKHSTEPAPALKAIVPGYPAGAAAAIARGLLKDPAQRFATCQEFVEAFFQGRQAGGPGLAAVSVPRKSRGEAGRVPCPKCHKTLRLKPQVRGRKVHCPSCSSRVHVSDDLTELTLLGEKGQAELSTAAKLPSGWQKATMEIGAQQIDTKLSPQQKNEDPRPPRALPIGSPPAAPPRTEPMRGVAPEPMRTLVARGAAAPSGRWKMIAAAAGAAAAILLVGLALTFFLKDTDGGPVPNPNPEVVQNDEPGVIAEGTGKDRLIPRASNSGPPPQDAGQRTSTPTKPQDAALRQPDSQPIRPAPSFGNQRGPTSRPDPLRLNDRRDAPPLVKSRRTTSRPAPLPQAPSGPPEFKQLELPSGAVLSSRDLEFDTQMIERLQKESEKEERVFSFTDSTGAMIIFEHDTKYVDGLAVKIDEDGALRLAVHMKKNLLSGKLHAWNEKAEMQLYAEYKNHKLEGLSCWLEQERPVLIQRYHYGKLLETCQVQYDPNAETFQPKEASEAAGAQLKTALDEAQEQARGIKIEINKLKKELKKKNFRQGGPRRAAERRARIRAWQQRDNARRNSERKSAERARNQLTP